MGPALHQAGRPAVCCCTGARGPAAAASGSPPSPQRCIKVKAHKLWKRRTSHDVGLFAAGGCFKQLAGAPGRGRPGSSGGATVHLQPELLAGASAPSQTAADCSQWTQTPVALTSSEKRAHGGGGGFPQVDPGGQNSGCKQPPPFLPASHLGTSQCCSGPLSQVSPRSASVPF